MWKIILTLKLKVGTLSMSCLFDFKSIVVVSRAKLIKIASVSKHLWTCVCGLLKHYISDFLLHLCADYLCLQNQFRLDYLFIGSKKVIKLTKSITKCSVAGTQCQVCCAKWFDFTLFQCSVIMLPKELKPTFFPQFLPGNHLCKHLSRSTFHTDYSEKK